MNTPPAPRELALDAAKQAINKLGMWLPPAGREAVVDAILAIASPATCCVCGGGPVTYRNYREQPFCQPCANGVQHVCKPGASVYYCPTAGEVESDCHGGFDTCCGQPERHLPLTDADPTVTELQEAARAKGLRLEFLVEEAPAPAAGYCPHCGRGDAGPTADEYAASQRRAVRIQQILDDTRDRVRKIHQPARDWSWTGLGCDHDGAHTNPCVHCRTCYPCPTAAALEPPKETTP